MHHRLPRGAAWHHGAIRYSPAQASRSDAPNPDVLTQDATTPAANGKNKETDSKRVIMAGKEGKGKDKEKKEGGGEGMGGVNGRRRGVVMSCGAEIKSGLPWAGQTRRRVKSCRNTAPAHAGRGAASVMVTRNS